MKRKFLNIISCFLSLFIFVGSFVFYVPSRVSAHSIIDYTISVNFSNTSSLTDSFVLQYYDDVFSNSNIINNGYTKDNSLFCLYYDSSSSKYKLFLIKPEQFVSDAGYVIATGSDWSYIVYDFTGDASGFASLSSFQPVISGFPFLNYGAAFPYPVLDSSVTIHTVYSNRSRGVQIDPAVISSSVAFVYKYVPSYSDDGLTGVIVGFDFSVEAFVQWLIDTEKYLELPSYIGTSKLLSFVQFYHDFGSSNNTFVSKIVDWLSHFNLSSQTLENRNILKSTIDRLYQEYCNQAFVTIQHDSSRLPHHRRSIETVTNDDDLTLVTDDSNDDIYTSLLRDILRGVISIPGQIYNCTEMIINKLDYLNWNVTVSNGGGSTGSDFSLILYKMDDIINKLEADTVSVEIDQTTKDDTDDFFDDWNLEFSTALNNKFPVAGQLSSLFTDFWEKCGVDADGDGETYEYYNPGVLTSSVSRSGSVGTSESDIVSDFLVNFDDADPAFLDDASFHGVPDLSVTVGGHSVSIIDFRVYAKYREKIHFIISFFIWTLYLLHLYKALPTIIGQVADVAVKTSDL